MVTDTDETELARQLERLERENAEVDGDDDAEEMEAKTEDWVGPRGKAGGDKNINGGNKNTWTDLASVTQSNRC